MALAVFFVLIAVGADPALVIGAALAGTSLLALAFLPSGVYEMETRVIRAALAGSPGIPAPHPFVAAEKKVYTPCCTAGSWV